jgi:DNA-nicking Smr family endonuclease
MIFDFLLKRLRRRATRDAMAGDEDGSLDPLNPFPDPVVIPFRDVLDLHAIPPKQARAVVEDYLAEARARGCTGVRIIHGKGIGVQREIVRAILARTPFVTHFADAPGEAGGWGATVVTLGPRKP